MRLTPFGSHPNRVGEASSAAGRLGIVSPQVGLLADRALQGASGIFTLALISSFRPMNQVVGRLFIFRRPPLH
jgi:hypothetical protein